MNFDKVLELYGLPGLILVLCALALYQRYQSRTKVEEARGLDEIDDDKTEEKLDQETRQLTNRLARVAFDREEQLQRLKTEYAEQSELLQLTRKQLELCQEVQVGEYRHQVEALLEQITVYENTIHKLLNDVAILESLK